MENSLINFAEKFSKFNEHWKPKAIAEMNDYQFKIIKLQGELIWHNHPETDKVFMVIKGKMAIEFKDETITLTKTREKFGCDGINSNF